MNSDSKLLLIKCMEERPRLSLNKHCPGYPSFFELKKEWNSIAKEMNSSGTSSNYKWTSFGARRKWSDLKYRVRKKALALEKMKKRNEKIPLEMKLTQLEKRVWALIQPKISSGESTPSTSDDASCRVTDIRTQQESSDVDDSASDSSMDEPDDRIEKNGSMDVPDDRIEKNGSIDVPDDKVENNGSMDEPDDRIEKNVTTRNTSILREDGKFKQLFGLQRSKLDIRKEELLIRKEKLELKKQKIALMKKQLTVQTNTLEELKTICKLMGKKYKINI